MRPSGPEAFRRVRMHRRLRPGTLSVLEPTIRPDTTADYSVIDAVNAAAFAATGPDPLVGTVRAQADPVVSLVAEHQAQLIGHVLFSPVTLSGSPCLPVMALGPVGVLPEYQRRGVGSALIEAGVAECQRLGMVALFVLGHPTYYPRFGFVPSVTFGIDCQFNVPSEVFMAKELRAVALAGRAGRVTYHPAFSRSTEK